jgi:phage terminase large subunit-like protein
MLGLSAIGVTPEHESGKFESGQVFFPNDAPWLSDLETELFAFPNSRHDDQVDSISQALSHQMSGELWDRKSLDGLNRFVSMLALAQRFG